MLENDIYLSLPSNQPDTVFLHPVLWCRWNSSLNTRGPPPAASTWCLTSKPAFITWSDPQWSAPSSTYTLNGGGSSVIPELQLEVPEGNLDSAPDSLEIEARVYAVNSQGQDEEVAIRTITLDFEEVDVFAPPRLFVYEDDEHQKQIADSTRPKPTTRPCLTMLMPTRWAISTSMCSTRASRQTRSRSACSNNPTTGSTDFMTTIRGLNSRRKASTADARHRLLQILTIRMEVYPPADRDGVDIGLFQLSVMAKRFRTPHGRFLHCSPNSAFWLRSFRTATGLAKTILWVKLVR